MRESELLGHIYRRSADLGSRFPQVAAGPGHDCAVVNVAGGQILLKVDQLVGGRHYRPFPATPLDLIARKAVARAVSDIAAAGGSPLAGLAAAVLPAGFSHGDELFDATARWGAHFGCPLVGGDIASGDAGAPLLLSLTATGVPHPVRGPVLRSGAAPGDGVYVTGRLGGSFDHATGLGRHLTFEPRLREARWLCDALGADLHAMMDLSDGLGRDSARLAAASGVRIRMEAGAIPLNPGTADWRAAAGDGEDYELLFAAGAGASVPRECPETGTPVMRIGTVEAGGGAVVVDGGREVDVAGMGWEHGQSSKRKAQI